MRKRFIASLLMLGFCVYAVSVSAQVLALGDKFPDVNVTIQTGDSVEHNVHLSDFKGKAIILDYWSTTCSPCIAQMPEMLRLQQQFKNKIVILHYTKDNVESYNKLFKSRSFPPQVLYAARHLPVIFSDTVLTKMIPYKSMGIKSWIDTNMIYSAGRYDRTNAEEIQAFLDGKKLQSGTPELFDYVTETKWFAKRFGFADHMLKYSLLTSYDERFERGRNGAFYDFQFQTDSVTNKITGFNMINACAVDLFAMAYFKGPIDEYRFFADAFNPYVYYRSVKRGLRTYEEQFEWIKTHKYCYAIKIPASSNEDVFTIMRNDLDKFFNVKSGIEKRTVKSWILKRTTKEDRMRTKDSTASVIQTDYFDDKGNRHFRLKNSGIGVLATAIDGEYFMKYYGPEAIPFFDETNYTGNVDIDIPFMEENGSVPLLNKRLAKYGLELVMEDRTIDVLAIHEIHNNN